MAQAKPKRQHHVNPQFYLRGFQCEEGEDLIWVYDGESGDAKQVPIKVAAVQKDYYSFVNPEGLRDTEYVENFLADMEGHAATVFRKYSAGAGLTDEERTNFALSIAMFFLRAPATRRQIAELIAGFARATGRACATNPQHFRKTYRRMEEDKGASEGDRVSDEEIEEAREFMLGSDYTIEVAKEVTLLPLAHLVEAAKTIFEMVWTRVHAPEDFEFITSDSPVVREVPPQHEHPMMGPGLRNPHIEVSLPLSPSLMWMGTWNDDMLESGVTTREYAKLLNKLRAFHAERFLYSSTHQSDVAKLAVKYRGAGWKLASSGFGLKGEPIETKTYKSKHRGIAPPNQEPGADG